MLALGYLAAIAKKKAHDVTILDCKLEKFDYSDFDEYMKDNHFDLIGFQAFTYDLNSIRTHIDIIRKYDKKVLIMVGGAHPSGDPIGTLKYLKHADFALKGEGEIGFEKFLKNLARTGNGGLKTDYEALKGIPGLIFRDHETNVCVNEPSYVEDLDSLDFPTWELIDPRSYPEASHGAFARQFPVAPIIITRGCPYRCTFCAGKAITGNKIRKRSIDNVWAEVEYLTERFDIKELLIEDENFTLHKDLLNEFCLKAINSKKKISWSFPSGVRLETLSADNLRLMEEAGCYSMALGIEFGSQRIHDLTKKGLKIDLIKDKIALVSKTRIKTTGFFLLGIPGETNEDIRSTIKFSLDLKINRAQFNNFMPLPGSELWGRLMKEEESTDTNWDNFFVHDVALASDDLSKKELKNLQRLAYLKFYCRPSIIFKLLREIKSMRHLKMLTKRFVDALS